MEGGGDQCDVVLATREDVAGERVVPVADGVERLQLTHSLRRVTHSSHDGAHYPERRMRIAHTLSRKGGHPVT